MTDLLVYCLTYYLYFTLLYIHTFSLNQFITLWLPRVLDSRRNRIFAEIDKRGGLIGKPAINFLIMIVTVLVVRVVLSQQLQQQHWHLESMDHPIRRQQLSSSNRWRQFICRESRNWNIWPETKDCLCIKCDSVYRQQPFGPATLINDRRSGTGETHCCLSSR